MVPNLTIVMRGWAVTLLFLKSSKSFCQYEQVVLKYKLVVHGYEDTACYNTCFMWWTVFDSLNTAWVSPLCLGRQTWYALLRLPWPFWLRQGWCLGSRRYPPPLPSTPFQSCLRPALSQGGDSPLGIPRFRQCRSLPKYQIHVRLDYLLTSSTHTSNTDL